MGRKKRKKRATLLEAVTDELNVADELRRFERGEHFGETRIDFKTRRLYLMLMKGKRSNTALGSMFGVSRQQIAKDRKAIKREVSRAIELDVLVGALVLNAEALTDLALERGDIALAWKISVQRIEILRDLGYLTSRDSARDFSNTMEQIGEGYERFAEILAKGLDPALTGEVEPDP